MASTTTSRRDRTVRQEPFAEHQYRQRREAQAEYDEIGLAELARERPDTFKEMVAASADTEKFRQLGHGDGQCRAGLETEQDRIADKGNQPAQAQHPCQYTQTGHDESRQGSDLYRARRIASCHIGDRDTDEQGNRRGRSDRQLPRRAERRVQQPAK